MSLIMTDGFIAAISAREHASCFRSERRDHENVIAGAHLFHRAQKRSVL
jgi:hypothetical protein